MKKALALLLAACTLFVCAAGLAEAMHEEIGNDALDMDIRVGFDGMMTYGKTMPVRVRVRNFGDDFEGVLAMNGYVSKKEYDRYEKEIFVPAGSEREFELALTVYAAQDVYSAELVKDGEVVCRANGKPGKTVNPAAMLVGVLSTRPQNLNNLNIDLENDVLGRYEMWQTVRLTADTFPEDAALLRSFGMLVIDDFDPATLTQKQQDLLATWLRSGKILLVGGGAYAARNAAFFGQYTGLKMEDVTTSDSVLEGLEGLLGRAASGRKPSCALAVLSGDDALAGDAEGRGLVWRTKVGGGRIYTAAFELGDPRLNSESLMGYFWQQLLINMDQEVYNAVMQSSSDTNNVAAVAGTYSTTVAAKSHLAVGLLIVLGVLVISCAAWSVLKRKDSRQWMWLVLPVTALMAVGGILLLSTGAETNRPLAVIADNLVQDSSGAVMNYSGISVAAPAFGRHSYGFAGERLRVRYYDYVDYDLEDEDKKQIPDQMRTCYTSGGDNAVTAESLTPWSVVSLTAESPAQIQGQITGTVWMEEDGLHGQVVNETDASLEAGRIVTTYGFASVPALAPGEQAEFTMIRKTMKDPEKPVYEDGGMYPNNPGLYQVISNAVGYDDNYAKASAEDQREREMLSNMINGASDLLRRDQGNWSYGAYESAVFLYSAKPVDAPESVLKVDGVPVTQKTNMTLLTAELPFTAVGRTGVVFRSAGMDMPDRVETDENRMPTDEQVQFTKQLYYHTLSDTPTFRYRMEGMAGVKVEKLQVMMENYYVGQCKAFALNAKAQKWETIKLNEPISNPGNYVDENGTLYLQFRTNSQDMYMDIPTPLITLEGRLEHAEN